MPTHSYPSSTTSETVAYGAGDPLLLAHGAGGSVQDNFAPLAPLLPHRRLIGPNYPGSDGSPDPTAPLRLADLADAIVQAGVDAGFERFPVLGLSLGSAVAVTAAARHPERVSGLVLTVGLDAIDAQGATFAALFSSLARARRIDDLARVLFLATDPTTLAAVSPAEAERSIHDIVAAQTESAARRAPQMDLVSTVDVRDLVPRIAVPVLTIVAGADRILLPQTTRRLGSAFPDGEVVELATAGHIFTEEHLDRWATHIDRFLTTRSL